MFKMTAITFIVVMPRKTLNALYSNNFIQRLPYLNNEIGNLTSVTSKSAADTAYICGVGYLEWWFREDF